MTNIADINRALELLHVADPIVDWTEPVETNPTMYQGLALIYSNEGFRKYLENKYRDAVKTAALKSRSEIEVALAKAQALCYKRLLVDAKNAFENLQKFQQSLKNKNNGKQSS